MLLLRNKIAYDNYNKLLLNIFISQIFFFACFLLIYYYIQLMLLSIY